MSKMEVWFTLLVISYFAKLQLKARAETWNYYKNGADWEGKCQTGKMQSPIDLSKMEIEHTYEKLIFLNYDTMLQTPLILQNNGHSLKLNISETVDGQQPLVTGAHLKSLYEAVSLHFHWGSPSGSEHSINHHRYQAEMHLVHKNVNYKDIETARHNPDGLLVLGVMLDAVKTAAVNDDLGKIFNQMSHVVKPDSQYALNGTFTLNQILTHIKRDEYFTYKGSLTTPNCDEAVDWIVFSKQIPIPEFEFSKLRKLLDTYNQPLINNYRLEQKLNERVIIYRSEAFLLKA